MSSAPTPTDFVELAQRLPRARFVAACPFLFLAGAARGLVRPVGQQRTRGLDSEEITRRLQALPTEDESSGAPVLLAVRKTQATFPTMITLGRTSNNDIIVADVSVSKFHAFFRLQTDRMELLDAGSRNGTWVGKRQVDTKTAVPVKVGDSLRFGGAEYTLIDPGTCWDELRDTPDW